MAEIVLENVTKRFGGTVALDNVSLTVPDGSFVVLLGPTGAGKTTTLRMVSGLDAPDSGEVFIDGRPMKGLSPAERNVAMVFQQYSLYPHLTVRQNLEFPLKSPLLKTPRAAIDRKVREVAEVLQIAHKLENKATALSGGEMQRVSIGRALVRNPQIFLMDEPLSSLDAKLRADLRIELKRIQAKLGATLLYVTHDQIEAMTMATHVGVLNEGRLVQFGSPREVYEQPATIEVAKFIGSPRINILPGEAGAEGRISVVGAATDAVAPRTTGKLDIGIRPEHLVIADDGLAIIVRHVEFLGSEVLVYARDTSGGDHLTVRLDPQAWERAASHETLTVAPQPGKLLAFDAAGNRVGLISTETAAQVQAHVPSRRVPRYV